MRVLPYPPSDSITDLTDKQPSTGPPTPRPVTGPPSPTPSPPRTSLAVGKYSHAI